jgi:hypothetical protein
MDIRESTTSSELHPEVKVTMIKFWEAYDKLWVDMETLTKEEYKVRASEMWSHRNKAMDIDGTIFLLTLGGLSEKYNKLYGEDEMSW